jgi:DNA-binding beta-propeller fold protein YncE
LNKRQKRKLSIVITLLVLLALLVAYFSYYSATRKLTFNFAGAATGVDTIQAPQFLYAFSGTVLKLQRPIGVYVDRQADRVYTCDSAGRVIQIFDQAGNFKGSFGTSITVIPLNIAENPKNGELWVTDRRLRSIMRFNSAGKYLGDFNPNLPKSELPTFNSQGNQWAPVALAFAPDGSLYVTDILKAHRLLIFNAAGQFVRSVGDTGQVVDATKDPGVFEFPNGVVYHSGYVYVTDSNNGRIQVFDKNGNFQRIIVTQGLPRGIDFLDRFSSDKSTTPDRMVVVDTLSHFCTIWTTKGDKVVSFGEEGILDGQFSYPDGVSVGTRNRIFVADTSNGRIQVWGWPEQVSPVPVRALGNNAWLCGLPLLLLPLLLLLRRKKFFATRDFILDMQEREELDILTHRRRKWFVTEEDYEVLKSITQGEVKLEDVLNPRAYSESDARDLMNRLEIDMTTAIILSIAKRIPVFVTEDTEYRRLAKIQEIDVYNRVEFLKKFEKRSQDDEQPKTES